jgi:hypothetical protein
MDIAWTLARAAEWAGCKWELSGDAYAGLVWHDGNPARKPGEAEIAAAYQRERAAAAAEKARAAGIRTDAGRIDLLQRLRSATPAQVGAYVDNNVTDLAGARALLKKILLLIALQAEN